MKAGDLAGAFINAGQIAYDGVLAADAEAFQYGALGSTRYDWDKKAPAYYVGYRALASGGTGWETIGGERVQVSYCEMGSTIYRDNQQVNKTSDYLRAEKEYAARLSANLAFPYNVSYNVTWKSAVKKITERGTAQIYPTAFLTKSAAVPYIVS